MFFIICLSIVLFSLIIIAFILFHYIFTLKLSSFTFEIIAAVLGTVFTVATMTLILKVQYKEEEKREYTSIVFTTKIKIYEELLELIFSMDDDNKIEEEEITKIENKIGEACLVANGKLVSMLSLFILQLKIYGCMYARSMDKKQVEHFIEYFKKNRDRLSTDKQNLNKELIIQNFEEFFISLDEIIQGLRDDLAVVEGNVQEMIEHFIDTPINKYKMMKLPTYVDYNH